MEIESQNISFIFKKFSCKQCYKQYDLQGSIVNHINKKHKGDKSLVINNNPMQVGRPRNSIRIQHSNQTQNQEILQNNLSYIPKSLEKFVSTSIYRGIMKQASLYEKSGDSEIPEQLSKKMTKAFKQLLKSRRVSLCLNKASKDKLMQIFLNIKISVWPHLAQEHLLPFNHDLVLALVTCAMDDSLLIDNVKTTSRYLSFEKLLMDAKEQYNLHNNNSNNNDTQEFQQDEIENQPIEQSQQDDTVYYSQLQTQQDNPYPQDTPITQSNQGARELPQEESALTVNQQENSNFTQFDQNSGDCCIENFNNHSQYYNYEPSSEQSYQFVQDHMMDRDYQQNNYFSQEYVDSSINTYQSSNSQYLNQQQNLFFSECQSENVDNETTNSSYNFIIDSNLN